MYHIFYIHSSAHEYLGCFHVLGIVNTTSMNTEMQVIMFFSWIYAQEWDCWIMW